MSAKKFFFPPPTSAPTSSAGVFNSSDVLVRTLWSAVQSEPRAANLATAWDGLLDDGSVATTGTYTVKLLKNSVQYKWDGALANSSSDHTTQFYHNYYAPISDMAITAAGEMYYTTQYNEREPCIRVGTTADIQTSRPAAQNDFRTGYSGCLFTCSDGTLTYFAVQENPDSYIVALSTTDGAPVLLCTKTGHTFSSGTSRTFGSFSSACGLATSGGGPVDTQITGLAVQQSGSYLFASRGNGISPAQVLTYNKTTGALLQTDTSFTNPQRLATSPTTGDVWLIHDTAGPVTKIDKYTVDGGGNLVSASVTITGLTAPLALAVSPDGATLLVCDGGTSQTVKAFNTSDGSVKTAFGTSGVFGTVGGYVNSPTVTNTKFMFTTNLSASPTWIAFASDASFWLGDNGNSRALHFTSGNSPTYVEQICYIGLFYSQRTVRGDSTRVLANWLEFTVDYSKPIAPNNGSWVLSKNWFGNISPTFMPAIDAYTSQQQFDAVSGSSFDLLKFATVASNGRTYAGVSVSTFVYRIFELTSTGLRVCGVIGYSPGLIPLNDTYLDSNLNQWYTEAVGAGSVCNIWKNAFDSFDVNHDPTFVDMSGAVPGQARGSIVYTSQTLPAAFSQTWSGDGNLVEWSQTDLTASGKIIFWNPDSSTNPDASYHLSAMDAATGNIKWMTHQGQPSKHGGAYIDSNDTGFLLYPDAPTFPYGNRTGGNGGGPKLYLAGDANIFTVYNGEDWGGNQTNVISHWHDSGLLVNRFGAGSGPNFGQPFLGPYFASASIIELAPNQIGENIIAGSPFSWKGLRGFAGNCRWGSLALVSGVYYLHQNDEWYHGGIGRWSVHNTSSIALTTHSVSWVSGSYVAPNDPGNLLQGLPYNSTVADNTAGWHRSPTTDTLNSPTNWVAIYTNSISCDRFKPDLTFQAKATPATYTLYRDFPAGGTGNWTLSGAMWYGQGTVNQDVIYFDILDSNGRIILRQYAVEDESNNGFWYVNNVIAKSVPAGQDFRFHNQAKAPFSIIGNVSNGIISIDWGGWIAAATILDPLADVTHPSRLILTYSGPNPGFGNAAIVFTDLHWVR